MPKRKSIRFTLEFNPGTMKYEPVLPLRKEKEDRIGFDWKLIIILLILIAVFFLVFYS